MKVTQVTVENPYADNMGDLRSSVIWIAKDTFIPAIEPTTYGGYARLFDLIKSLNQWCWIQTVEISDEELAKAIKNN